jgi:hypothetical protein
VRGFANIILALAAPLSASPTFRVIEEVISPAPGCTPDDITVAPHYRADCVTTFIDKDGRPRVGHFRALASAEGSLTPAGLELHALADLDAVGYLFIPTIAPAWLTPVVRAQVIFGDAQTVAFSPLLPPGDPMKIRMSMRVSGRTCLAACEGTVVVLPPWAKPTPLATLSVGNGETFQFNTGTFDRSSSMIAELDVLNGVPFYLQIFFDATVSADTSTAADLLYPEYRYFNTGGAADFSHTVTIAAVTAESSGVPLGPVSLSSSDGHSLIAAAAVPEPGTWLLALCAVAGFWWMRRSGNA